MQRVVKSLKNVQPLKSLVVVQWRLFFKSKLDLNVCKREMQREREGGGRELIVLFFYSIIKYITLCIGNYRYRYHVLNFIIDNNLLKANE